MKAIHKSAILTALATLAMAMGSIPAQAQSAALMAPPAAFPSPESSPAVPVSQSDMFLGDLANMNNNLWTINASALFLTRSTPTSALLVTQNNPTAVLLDARSLDLGFSVGPRLDANLNLGGIDFGFVYYGLDGWGLTRDYSSTDNLQLPFVLPNTNFSSTHIDYFSKLYNIEANTKMHIADRFHLLGGFRWTEIKEGFAQSGTGSQFSGEVTSGVTNDLFGGQIGLEGAILDNGGPFHIDSFVKAGVFGNSLQATVQNYNVDSRQVITTTNDGHVAFLGEVGLTANWQITSNLATFVGAECMWIDGISIAPDMIVGKPTFTTTSIYWGGLSGVEVKW